MRYLDTHCTYTEERYGNKHIYVFTGPCLITHKMYSVRVPADELFAWRNGEYIQKALKSVSAEDREFLMTGYSPEGWKQMFYDDEDYDDDYDNSCDNGCCPACGHPLQDDICQNTECDSL